MRQPSPSLDQARLLPRYRVDTDRANLITNQAATFRAEYTRAKNAGIDTSKLIGEPADLRGIPCIAQGVGGVQPGTNPEQATIAKLTPREYRHG